MGGFLVFFCFFNICIRLTFFLFFKVPPISQLGGEPHLVLTCYPFPFAGLGLPHLLAFCRAAAGEGLVSEGRRVSWRPVKAALKRRQNLLFPARAGTPALPTSGVKLDRRRERACNVGLRGSGGVWSRVPPCAFQMDLPEELASTTRSPCPAFPGPWFLGVS